MKRLTLLLLALCGAVSAQPPAITKIEPPDWVSSSKPLLMLLSGSGLTGAQIDCAGLPVARVETNPNGTHLFFELTPDRPGRHPCTVRTSAGTATIPFQVLPPLPAEGRFQGLSDSDVIYLIMPDRFANGDPANDNPLHDRTHRRFYHGGDFAGIQAKLRYLKDLGVTALWLTPVVENSNLVDPVKTPDGETLTSYHGYGATDLYAVEDHFGTLDSYRALVDEAHRLGLKVIQDQVENHTGPRHPWVDDPPRPTWFHGTREHHPDETWQTWALLDPHSGPLLHGVLDGWFAGILPDLNQDAPAVARYLIQNSTWWIARTGVDVVRQDTVPYVPRTFWRQWTTALHQLFPKLTVIGEVLDPDPVLTSSYQHDGFDSVFDFPLYFAIRDVFARHQPPVALAKLLAHDRLYPAPQRLVTLLGLHDTKRFLSEPGATPEDLANAFTFLFTTRGVPMIYYGDEIGLSGGDDPENRHDFPGGWPGDARNAFTAAGRTADENRLFDHLRRLTRLRASSMALRSGTTRPIAVTDTTYAFLRESGAERLLIIVHTGAKAETRQFDVPGVKLECKLGCTGEARPEAVPVAPRSTAVYRVRN